MDFSDFGDFSEFQVFRVHSVIFANFQDFMYFQDSANSDMETAVSWVGSLTKKLNPWTTSCGQKELRYYVFSTSCSHGR